jgi:hypothetical protein
MFAGHVMRGASASTTVTEKIQEEEALLEAS